MREKSSCYSRALRLLATAEHCTRGLERKLLARGYGQEEVAQTLTCLTDENILNDSRFAELWIEFRQRRKDEGARLLAAGLLRRGVDRDTAEKAVRAASRTAGYEAALARARGKILAEGCNDEAAVTALLMRKGFSAGEIRKNREAAE